MTAVLCLALAGSAAHAQDLTVEIIDPPTDPFDVIVGTEQDFEAVAYLDGEPLASEQVTWEWDFDDGSDPDSDNPTTHTFTTAGQYTVSILATYSSMSAGAEVVANQLPAIANNWDFFARPDEADELRFGAEVCDDIELAFRTTDMGLIFMARFSARNPDGSWSPVGNGDFIWPDVYQPPEGWYQEVDSATIFTSWAPNRTTMYRVEVSVEVGGEGGPFWISYFRHLQLDSDNTAVHEGEAGGLLLHEQTTQHHQIAWDIEHHPTCASYDWMMDEWQWDDPSFGMMVDIYALGGSTPLVTLFDYDTERGAGSLEWDGTIPGQGAAPVGIYTYVVIAQHQQPAGACDDQDKSGRLSITVHNFYWFEKDPVAGTLRGVVKYSLSRAAADTVTIRFYGADLTELDGAACPLEGQPCTAGPHFSDVYELNVAYDENDALVEPIYCVVFAEETADDGALNRDGLPKPALQRGTSQLTAVTNHITPSGPVMISTLHDDDYPLEQQTADGQITVTAHFDKEWAGQQIYLAVFDPPDMSPYVSDPQNWEAIWTDDTKWGDNADGPGTLSTAQATAVLVGEGEDEEAVVTAVLTITDQHAGDNYVVAAQPGQAPTIRRAMEEFNGGAGHLLVAWARKYYTVGEMYERGAGAVLNRYDKVPIEGGTAHWLWVSDLTPFDVDDTVHVFSTGTLSQREGETRTVLEKVVDGNNNYWLRIDSALEVSYSYGEAAYKLPQGFVGVVGNRYQLAAGWPALLLAAYGDVGSWAGVEPPEQGQNPPSQNGGAFTQWRCAHEGTLPLPHSADPRFGGTLPGWEAVWRATWAWHPDDDEADHDFISVCERQDMTDDHPGGETPVHTDGTPWHASYVYIDSCGVLGFNTGKTAVHELGHFMGIQKADSDENHAAHLAHPHRTETYNPQHADYGCVMDNVLANQGNTYCEFCVQCIGTVRAAGER